MSKIPTAEEFIKGKSNDFDTQKRVDTFFPPTVERLCIQFAKLHVEEALKAASEKVESRNFIEKETILNAYPLDDIK